MYLTVSARSLDVISLLLLLARLTEEITPLRCYRVDTTQSLFLVDILQRPKGIGQSMEKVRLVGDGLLGGMTF